MSFKEGQLDIAPMGIIDINMQSAPAVDQSKILVNTSMVVGKSLQAIETKIDKLNKKIDQYKKDYSLKDKTFTRLQNKNKYLLAKLDKQKLEFEKSLTKTKVELNNANQVIQDLKAQATVVDDQKFKQVEAEL